MDDYYITQEFADERGYLFVAPKYLDRHTFGVWLKPEIEEHLKQILKPYSGKGRGQAFVLLASDNTPQSKPVSKLDPELHMYRHLLGEYGDWEICSWLWVPDPENHAIAKVFLSA